MQIKAKTKKKLLIIAASIVGALLVFKLLLVVLPFSQFDDFLERQYSTRFYDRNGELLQILPLHEGLRREWYALEDLPTELVDVFIAAEDKNFYAHGGIDFFAIIRAALQNIEEQKTVSGASTISMQLARIIRPRTSQESLMVAKMREAWLALLIEARLSKDEVLELYLNSLPFGRQAEGVGSALRTYFGTTPSQASIAQIYAVAVIPRRPSLYDPRKNPQAVYDQAVQIDAKPALTLSYNDWLERVSLPAKFVYPAKAQHFILYVMGEYAKKGMIIPSELHLTLDNELSENTAKLISEKLELYAYSRLSNGAAFAIDNKTGEILVWVGNGDFYDERGGQIDGVRVLNQAGSSMKPFLYALALENGILPSTVLADVPQEFGAENVYIPMNFNNRYNGPQTMRISLASSLNIPSVSLLYRLGVSSYMETLQELGFASLDNQRDTGLSLALGSGEVTLFELVRAFSAFPLDGMPIEPIFTIPSTTKSKDSALTKRDAVYSADTTRIICDFLSDKSAQSLGFGLNEVFATEYPSIFKTGTSNQFQDIVALGATPDFTVGCWMGNFSGDTVIQKTGSTIPAEIVRESLDALMQPVLSTGIAPKTFALPQHYAKQTICALSGLIPTPACTQLLKEFLPTAQKIEQAKTCDWHYVINGKTTVRYPEEYQRWFSSQRNIVGNLGAVDNLEFSENYGVNREGQSTLTILSPINGSIFVYDPSIGPDAQQMRVDCIGGTGTRASLFIDGSLFEEQSRPYIWYVPIFPGTHKIEIRENSGETTSITIEVQGSL